MQFSQLLIGKTNSFETEVSVLFFAWSGSSGSGQYTWETFYLFMIK